MGDARQIGGRDRRARRGYADGPYGQVHYHDTGSGVPLVLLHQAPLNARQFEAVTPRLADAGIRAIAIDLPGFGLSDETPMTPTIQDYARAIPPVLDHLGLDRVNLLGHHTGAMVATEVALAVPERVDSLILNGPVPLSDEERRRFLQDVEVREKGFSARADGSHLSEAFAGRVAYVSGSVPLDRINQYIIWMLMGYGPFWYGHHAAFQYDHAPGILQIAHRTLVLTNTGDAIFEHAKLTHDLRPDFGFVALQGGGIDIQDQCPGLWAQAVVDFLRVDCASAGGG